MEQRIKYAFQELFLLLLLPVLFLLSLINALSLNVVIIFAK